MLKYCDAADAACLLWAGHKYNCGITGIRKAEKMSTADENIEAVKKMIFDNRRITIREVADDVGISFDLWQAIFTDVLGMKRCLGQRRLIQNC